MITLLWIAAGLSVLTALMSVVVAWPFFRDWVSEYL